MFNLQTAISFLNLSCHEFSKAANEQGPANEQYEVTGWGREWPKDEDHDAQRPCYHVAQKNDVAEV